MKDKLTIYKDGAIVRKHNKKYGFSMDSKGSLNFMFLRVIKNAEKPACSHHCHRNKVRDTRFRMTKEAFEDLMYAYIEYLKQLNDKV